MDLVRVLESYRGRDRIIRLSTYAGMFISGDRQAYMFDRIRAICTDLSGCRVMLRLFDDLPMLLYNLSCTMKLFMFKMKVYHVIFKMIQNTTKLTHEEYTR
jgi:peroxin-11C